MSFYGNSYQYLAETFARIIIKNQGLNNKELPTDLNSNPINIDADTVDDGVAVYSGNHWVALEPINNPENPNVAEGFTIWHNKPITTGALNRAIPEGLKPGSSKLPLGIESQKVDLKFDDYLKLPVITYDQAGHISVSTEASQYFKLPSDPSGPFYDRLWKIDGIDPNGVVTEPPGGSLKMKLLNRMSSIDGLDENYAKTKDYDNSVKGVLEKSLKNMDEKVSLWEGSIKTANSTADTAKKTADDAWSLASTTNGQLSDLEKSVNETNGSIVGFLSRLTALENQVFKP